MNKSLGANSSLMCFFIYTTHVLDPLLPPHKQGWFSISKLYRVGDGDLQGICEENCKALRRKSKIIGNYEYCITVPHGLLSRIEGFCSQYYNFTVSEV